MKKILLLAILVIPTSAQDDPSLIIGFDGSLATLKGLRAGFATAPLGYKFTRENLLEIFDKTIEIIAKQRAEELKLEQERMLRQKAPVIQ